MSEWCRRAGGRIGFAGRQSAGAAAETVARSRAISDRVIPEHAGDFREFDVPGAFVRDIAQDLDQALIHIILGGLHVDVGEAEVAEGNRSPPESAWGAEAAAGCGPEGQPSENPEDQDHRERDDNGARARS